MPIDLSIEQKAILEVCDNNYGTFLGMPLRNDYWNISNSYLNNLRKDLGIPLQ
jgi:hypothetical protein